MAVTASPPAARHSIDNRSAPISGGVVGSHRWTATGVVGLAVAAACCLFVFVQMRPDLLFADTTPSGGDMGAHVWGPAYLRDHLLGQGRLAGWTTDWYAGFPAYHFYMVVPSLAIVAINAGLGLLLGIPMGLMIVGGTIWLTQGTDKAWRLRLLGVLAALLILSVPYGIAFKLVSVVGLVFFPLSAWIMGRLARAPEPIPAFLSVGSLIFLFDTNFTIYGGNIASTLAGEFAFVDTGHAGQHAANNFCRAVGILGHRLYFDPIAGRHQ